MIKLALIQNYLFYTGFISEIIPLIFCILFYKKLNTKALKVFFIYAILLCFFSSLSLLILKVIKDRTTYFFVIRLFNICEFTTIAIFIYHILKVDIARKIVLYTIPPFIIYAIVDYLLTEKNQFNNHSNVVSALLIILFIIYYFFEKMKTVVMYPLYQSISFWICVGLFLNFTGIFFFILFINSSTDKEFKILMNSIVGIVTLTKNILLCLSLFATENTEQEDDELHIPNDMDLGEFSLTNLKNP